MRTRVLKPFYYYTRNGIIYYVSLDPITREKRVAKSTGTRDINEAQFMMWTWYLSEVKKLETQNASQIETNISKIQKIIQATIKQELANANLVDFYGRAKSNTEANNTNALGKYANYSLYDFLKEFWDYEKSPYLEEQKREGKNLAEPERFVEFTNLLKFFKAEFEEIPLNDIQPEKINKALLTYKNKRKITDTTMLRYSKVVKQPLAFLYRHGYTIKNFSDSIVRFSGKSEKKEIFTEKEITEIFSNKDNFTSEKRRLVIKSLYLTGCRIGEILALQPSDLQFVNNTYCLNISKNWTTTGRLKTTKTRRVDCVLLPYDFGKELENFINEHSKTFVFQSTNNDFEPVSYDKIAYEFNMLMKKLGIKRKGLTLHSFRHTYATILRDAGFSTEEMLFLTRHDSRECLDVYIKHATAKSLKNQEKALSYISAIIA